MYMESALQYYFLWDNFYINSVFCSISGIQSGMQVNTDMQTVLFNLGADTSLKPDAIMPVGDIVMVLCYL